MSGAHAKNIVKDLQLELYYTKMTLQELKLEFQEALKETYPSEEVQSFFHILAHHYLGYSRFQVHELGATTIPESTRTAISAATRRLRQHEPIQYIIGQTAFYGLPFTVTPATLIPRPETEELVAWILKDLEIASRKATTFLDIGTGSGCIPISVAKHAQDLKVSALDISEEALQVATQNAIYNKVAINFFETDVLMAESLPETYDIIVSNPPYVRELEKMQMHANVLAHEPSIALFVSDHDPLLFYRKIAQLALHYLSEHGLLYLEINEYLSKEMCSLLKAEGFTEIELKKDIFGKDRMIKCMR